MLVKLRAWKHALVTLNHFLGSVTGEVSFAVKNPKLSYFVSV